MTKDDYLPRRKDKFDTWKETYDSIVEAEAIDFRLRCCRDYRIKNNHFGTQGSLYRNEIKEGRL